MVETIQNRVIFNGNIDGYKPKTEIIKGEPILVYPAHYKRSFINETGGLTTEYSLNPFENERKESNPR